MIFQVESNETVPEVDNYSKCQPVATENGFLLAVQHSSIMFWADSCKTVLNTKHRLPVTALCVSAANNPYACSCSDDKVIIWNVDDIYRSNTKDDTKPCAGLLVGVDLGAITDCTISCNNAWLALCRNNDIWVVHLQHENGVLTAVSHHATLEPVGESPTSCCFSPDVPNLLVTADESNTFKVWDAAESRLAQRSAVGAWHHVSYWDFVRHGSHRGRLLVATNRAVLHLFSVELTAPPRDLGVWRVSAGPPSRSTAVLVPREPGTAGTEADPSPESGDGRSPPSAECRLPSTPPEGPDGGSEAGCVILSALLVDADPPPPAAASPPGTLCPDQDDPVVDAILAPAPLLVVCTNLGVAVYDCHSWDCLTFQHYAELLDVRLSLVSAAVLAGRSAGRVRCLLTGWASSSGPGGPGPRGHLVSIACRVGQRPRQPPMSFLGLTTPGARSPLRAQLAGPAVDAAVAAYGSSRTRATSRAAPRVAADPPQPPPRAVKSSGYGVVQRRQRFVPVINRPRVSDKASKAAAGGAAGGALAGLLTADESWRSWSPPLRRSGGVSLWNDSGTDVQLASSGDGLSLACSCGPGVLSVLRWARPSVEDCVRIAGHDARVTSVCFSADSAWLMSASSDGRTKVWDWRGRRCVLDIDGGAGGGAGSGRRPGPATARTERARGHAVAKAAFYYLDRFILRAVSSTVELYCHRLHDGPGGPGGGRGWRRVRAVAFPTQQVTCFTAPNNFYSNVLVAGCASRSLHVYDVDAERFLAEVRDAHPRPPHTLVPASPSSTAPQGARAADLLVSAAVCDGAKLWDLRQARCVQKFTRHVNRALACGVSLSPCCRFLAAGSEDKCVYLYDTRKCTDYVDKLMGMNEAVVDVTWNSSKPQLAASALNSCVVVYDVHK